MSGLGNYGANMAAANVGPSVNAPAAHCGYGPGCGYTTTGAILVLFILLVIIARTICV